MRHFVYVVVCCAILGMSGCNSSIIHESNDAEWFQKQQQAATVIYAHIC